jgi:hypothetical protein
MLLLSPHLNARLDTLILAPSMGDTSSCTGGVSLVIKLGGGGAVSLTFVLRWGYVHFCNLVYTLLV